MRVLYPTPETEEEVFSEREEEVRSYPVRGVCGIDGGHSRVPALRYVRAGATLVLKARPNEDWGSLARTPTSLCARGPSAGSLDDRLHLVVIEGAQRGRPDVALRG